MCGIRTSRVRQAAALGGVIACVVASSVPCPAQTGEAEKTTVTVTGEGLNPQAAKMDALRRALEQGAGLWLASQSETENFELIRDTIFTKAEGIVSSYSILESGEGAGGTFYCKITAVVSGDAVAHEWGEVQNVLAQIGRPRIMVYITETVDGQTDTSSILESKIEERLVKLGFDVYDNAHLDAVRRREADHAAKSGDDAKMASIAKGFGAQIFVMGHANGNRAENTAPHGVNLVMYNCDVLAKVFYTDSGKLLASESLPNTRGGARGFTEYSRQAAKMAIDNAAAPLIDKVYETIMKSWATQISSGGELTIEISGFANASQAFKLKKDFAAIPNVVSVDGPEYTDGVGVFRIKAKMTAQELMDHLVEGEWDRLLEVKDVTLSRIQAK